MELKRNSPKRDRFWRIRRYWCETRWFSPYLKISNKFVKHPTDVVSDLGDVVTRLIEQMGYEQRTYQSDDAFALRGSSVTQEELQQLVEEISFDKLSASVHALSNVQQTFENNRW